MALLARASGADVAAAATALDELLDVGPEQRGDGGGGHAGGAFGQRGVADREADEALAEQLGVVARDERPAGEDDGGEALGGALDERLAVGGEQREQLLGAVAVDDGAHERVLGGGVQEDVEGGGEGAGGVVEVGADGALDGEQEAVGLAHDEHLGELVARAELLVEGLAADAGGERDVGHGDVGPAAACELLAGGVEQGVAQQLACGDGVGDALLGAGHGAGGAARCVALSGVLRSGSKSTLSRTPQSGQAQSSGTSLHGVPGGKPSRGCPCCSS